MTYKKTGFYQGYKPISKKIKSKVLIELRCMTSLVGALYFGIAKAYDNSNDKKLMEKDGTFMVNMAGLQINGKKGQGNLF